MNTKQRLLAIFHKMLRDRLGDTSEFLILDAHASIWCSPPCPACGKRFPLRAIGMHRAFHAQCDEETRPMPPVEETWNFGELHF